MQERRVREKINAQDFYTGLLKPELHLVFQGNPSLTLYYFKRFIKFTLLHFLNKQKHTQKTLESHKNHNSCRPGKSIGTHTKLEKDHTSVVAQPCPPQTPFPSFNHTKKNAPRIDPISIFTSCKLNDHERERISRFLEWFRAKKWSCYLSFENHITYSQTVTKFNRLILKSIG